MDNGAENYKRYLDGDDGGIVDIIGEYKDGLTLYLNGIVKNIFFAEELMEETFFILMTKKPKYKGKSTFKTWLYAIGRNTAVDALRKNSRLSDKPAEEYGNISDEETAVETAYLKLESRIRLHCAMKKLKSEYTQVLYLTYFEDFTNEQAAKAMNKSRRQIENLLYRAKKALKTELEKEGFTYEDI